MKSDTKINNQIRELISSKKFDRSLKFIEANKKKLNELDYWFYLSVNLRYLERYKELLSAGGDAWRLSQPEKDAESNPE